MPNNHEQTAIQTSWLNFVKSVKTMLAPQIDDRPLDQYLSFRDEVLSLVQSERFLMELNTEWIPPNDFADLGEIKRILQIELDTFPRMVEVAQSVGNPDEAKGWWKKMLGQASTVSGSVQDIVTNLPPYAKNALTLFKELIELFKGKD